MACSTNQSIYLVVYVNRDNTLLLTVMKEAHSNQAAYVFAWHQLPS